MASKNTRPELLLRKALTAHGLRYRIHRRELPGTPDIVFIRHKLAVFVHGCYWHGHAVCAAGRRTSGATSYWRARLESAVLRDQLVQRQLRELGFDVLVAWECDIAENAHMEADRIFQKLMGIRAWNK